jgi:NAD+ kinase
MTVSRLGLVIHGGKPAAALVAERVRAWAHAHGVPTADVDVWTDLTIDGCRRTAYDEAQAAGNPDLIVTIGGDGTFLRGARVAATIGGCVLGVDLGRVGFLTEVVASEIETALDAVHAGHADIEERLTLTLRASRPLEMPQDIQALLQYGRGPSLAPPPVRPRHHEDDGWGVCLDVVALNDVVFEKLARDRQASVGVYIGRRLLASYSADALIVGTPTGSTAYSFAAGGPVLSPRLDGLIFTPVAPHMVFDRSLVLAADEVVTVRVLERSGQVAVTIDGQLRGVLDPGDWVGVYAGTRRAKLIRLGAADFVGRLRERFGLADAAAAVADGQAPAVVRPSGPVPDDLRHLYLPD